MNSHIKVNKNSIFIKKWYNKGVKIIDDFLVEDNAFLSRESFEEKYNIQGICFMQYNSIISAISKFLKGTQFSKVNFSKLQRPFVPMLYGKLMLMNKCTKHIYKNINIKCVQPSAFLKWNSELVLKVFPEVELKNVFKVSFKTSTNSAVQWLQYIILHKILPVKHYLKKIQLIENETCTFCESECETILHVFFMCTKVLHIWNDLSLHIYSTTSKRVGFNVKNILFGETPLMNENLVINFIILYAKQYIFRCLKGSKTPNLYGLIGHLKMYYHVEKFISEKNNTTDNFDALWSQWKYMLEI